MAKKPIGESDDYAPLHPTQLPYDGIDAYYSVLSGDDPEHDARLRALFERLRSDLLSYGEPRNPDAHAQTALDEVIERSGRQADRGPQRKLVDPARFGARQGRTADDRPNEYFDRRVMLPLLRCGDQPPSSL